MKKAILLIATSLSTLTAMADGTLCTGNGVKVELNATASLLRVTTAQTSSLLKVTKVTSRTGDIDWTYHTASGVRLILDDQNGDVLVINGKKTQLTCQQN